MVIALIVAAVLAVAGVAYFATDGFGSNDSTQTQATNEDTSSSDNEQDEQEGEADDQTTLPSDFPEIVPIYQPSSVSTVNTSPSAGQTNYVVGFLTDASHEDVVDFYDQELSSNGWEIIISNDSGRFTASNNETRVVVDVTEAGDGAVFTVTAPQQ